MKKQFYALYEGTNDVLVFDTSKERNEYVQEERLVHPECKSVSKKKIINLIKDRTPVYDSGFGCMAILS